MTERSESGSTDRLMSSSNNNNPVQILSAGSSSTPGNSSPVKRASIVSPPPASVTSPKKMTSDPSTAAITFRGAHKAYGRRVPVLVGLDMTIPRGAIYGLLGKDESVHFCSEVAVVLHY